MGPHLLSFIVSKLHDKQGINKVKKIEWHLMLAIVLIKVSCLILTVVSFKLGSLGCSDEGLMLEMSATSLHGGNWTLINLCDTEC